MTFVPPDLRIWAVVGEKKCGAGRGVNSSEKKTDAACPYSLSMFLHVLCASMFYVPPCSMFLRVLCSSMFYVPPCSMFLRVLCPSMFYVPPCSMFLRVLCPSMFYVPPCSMFLHVRCCFSTLTTTDLLPTLLNCQIINIYFQINIFIFQLVCMA